MLLPTVTRTDYQTWRLILNDSKLTKSIVSISESFGIRKLKAEAVINEYNQSGCIIMQSKINFK